MREFPFNGKAWANSGSEAQGRDGSDDWEPPVPLRALNVPTFPTEALPAPLRAYAEALAVATQTPADLPAMTTLSVIAAASAKTVVVEVNPGWTEPSNLFTAVVLPPGNMKSAVLAKATAPLSEFQAGEAARLAPEIRRATARRKVAEKALENAQGKAAHGNGDDEDAALAQVARLVDELAGLTVAVAPRILADDVTPERLAVLMSEQNERMALLSAEGGLFGQMAGRYSSAGGPNLDVFLKGHAGDRLAVDRIGREPIHLEAPALTVGVTVQPDVIRSLADVPEFRGRGLLARFLYSIPRSLVGARDLDAPCVADEISLHYRVMVRALLSIEPAHENGHPTPYVLTLDRDAAGGLRAFRARLEPRLGEAGDLGMMADWGSKLAGAVVRIAGLLHMAGRILDPTRNAWRTPITGASMAMAVKIGHYLIPHAQAAFGLMGADPALEDAEHVLRWLRRDGRSVVSERDVYRGTQGGRLRKPEVLARALDILEGQGYVRKAVQERDGGPGRPPSPAWEVNPHCHNRQNARVNLDFGDSGNSAHGRQPSEAPPAGLEERAGQAASGEEILS